MHEEKYEQILNTTLLPHNPFSQTAGRWYLFVQDNNKGNIVKT